MVIRLDNVGLPDRMITGQQSYLTLEWIDRRLMDGEHHIHPVLLTSRKAPPSTYWTDCDRNGLERISYAFATGGTLQSWAVRPYPYTITALF